METNEELMENVEESTETTNEETQYPVDDTTENTESSESQDVELTETETQEEETQEGEAQEGELSETEGSEELEEGTVSGGDSTTVDAEMLHEIRTLLQENNALLQDIQSYEEKECMTAWEKPISDYTVQEVTGALILIVILAFYVFHIIGGIITCN